MHYSLENERKTVTKAQFAILGLVVAFLMVLVFVKDFIQFQHLTDSPYKTPWYSNDFTEPYTTLRLALADKTHVTEYWTKNAIGSQSWFVREVAIGDTKFWTILERVELEN